MEQWVDLLPWYYSEHLDWDEIDDPEDVERLLETLRRSLSEETPNDRNS
jgi:hypothetical protein